ncbi:MAG: amidase [Bacteroidota bacterium]
MIDTALLFAPIDELARLIKRKKLSPVELTEGFLSRIERINPKLNAFATVTFDLAMLQARQAEREIAAGLYRGTLHGIPYAAKDLFAVKGYPTTWGARPFTNRIIDRDATVITRLKDAGAILLGKCAMSELAGGPPTATATGACRTPWDLTRWSGGSSSGSGAAVAAGLAAFALGTETWGSIMTPASFCGVTGFRPSYGRISRAGAMALSWSMDKVGILARTATDSAEVCGELAGTDPEDESALDIPFKLSTIKSRDRFKGLRVGFIKEDYQKWGEPDVEKAFSESLIALAGLGFTASEIQLPVHPYETVASTIIAAEEAAAFEGLVSDGNISSIIDPDRRGELLGAQMISAVDYLRCQRMRTEIARDFRSLFNQCDIILGSSTLACAPPIDADMKSFFAGGNSIEAAENLLGLPGISVPCGFNGNKLPIGFKIIAQQLNDGLVLELAQAFQSVSDWHTRKPKI